MSYQLRVILGPEVQRVFDHFSACFNIRILFFDANGQMLSVGQNRPDSVYCRLMRRHLYGKQTCFAQDEAKRQESASTHSLVCYQCHAGLMEAIIPIYHQQQLLGTVFIGQFRSSEQISPWVKRDACASDVLSSVEAAFHELPYVPQERIDHILGLFNILVEYIIAQRMISMGPDNLVGKLVALMEQRISGSFTLQQAASAVGKSPSSVSHLFKKHFGQSFKQAFLEMKLAHADEMLHGQHMTSITQVAEAIGYDDPQYFSRLYKKHRGTTPSMSRPAAKDAESVA